MTIRKRLAVTIISSLVAGTLSAVAVAPVASAHGAVGSANVSPYSGQINGSLIVATLANTSGAAIPATASAVTTAGHRSTWGQSAAGLGLLSKDTTSGTAQTATMLAGGTLVLMAAVSTSAAFTATGGTFGTSTNTIGGTATYSESLRTVAISGPVSTTSTAAPFGATAVATTWTAPATAGSYTVSLGVADGVGNAPSTSSPLPALAGQIVVTVVAASAGGSFSAAYSACNTATSAGGTASSLYPSGVDGITSAVANGGSAFIDFDIDDAYNASLPATTNITVSATNGALVSLGSIGTSPGLGSASTLVSASAPTDRNVRVTQGVAGPVTTTVTIAINGVTACTKTVTIAGEVAKLVISDLGTQALSTGSTVYYDARDDDADGRQDGLFTVLAQDSAGNTVAPNPSTGVVGTFAVDPATLTTTVQLATVNSVATTTSSSHPSRFSLGGWTCGGTAGTSNIKIKFTNTSSGTVITSDAFAARCAGAPATYTASLDKASYVQGEIATLTVKFLDSKGNAANQKVLGAKSITMPMLTNVTGITSATTFAKPDGSRAYTFTVGGTTAITAGKYTGIVTYTALNDAGATTATPTYSIGTGTTDVAFSEVLKSIVALIASINKQIQALQKLILKR